MELKQQQSDQKADLEMTQELMNPLITRDFQATEEKKKIRRQAIKARDDGFPIIVRLVGSIDCETLAVHL